MYLPLQLPRRPAVVGAFPAPIQFVAGDVVEHHSQLHRLALNDVIGGKAELIALRAAGSPLTVGLR